MGIFEDIATGIAKVRRHRHFEPTAMALFTLVYLVSRVAWGHYGGMAYVFSTTIMLLSSATVAVSMCFEYDESHGRNVDAPSYCRQLNGHVRWHLFGFVAVAVQLLYELDAVWWPGQVLAAGMAAYELAMFFGMPSLRHAEHSILFRVADKFKRVMLLHLGVSALLALFMVLHMIGLLFSYVMGLLTLAAPKFTESLAIGNYLKF